jgi:hypothetical protein
MSDPISPDLAGLAARLEGLAAHDLVAPLRADQVARWRAGNGVPAEAYLAAFPALRTSAEDALVLICGEMLLRGKAGEAPLAEYQRRFPRFADELALQHQLQQVLADGTRTAAAESATEATAAATAPVVSAAALLTLLRKHQLLAEEQLRALPRPPRRRSWPATSSATAR